MLLSDNISVIDLNSCVSIEQEVSVGDECTAIGVHPDGSKIICGYASGAIIMYSLLSKRSELVYHSITDKITDMAFLNEEHFVTIIRDKVLQIHNLRTEACVFEFQAIQANAFYLQDMSYSKSFSVVSFEKTGKRKSYSFVSNIFYLDNSSSFKISNIRQSALFGHDPASSSRVHYCDPDYFFALPFSVDSYMLSNEKRFKCRFLFKALTGEPRAVTFHFDYNYSTEWRSEVCNGRLLFRSSKDILIFDATSYKFLGCLFGSSVKLDRESNVPHKYSIDFTDAQISIITSIVLGDNLTVIGKFNNEQKTIVIIDMSSRQLIWGVHHLNGTVLKTGVRSQFSDGRLVLTKGKRLFVASPPDNIRNHFRRNTDLRYLEEKRLLAHLPPLQKTLIQCFNGTISPSEAVSNTNLISKERSYSVAEWICGHHILMLAAYDDPSLRTTTYKGVESYWLENLYASFKDLPISNDHEYYDTLKKLLREAENVGVLSNREYLISDRLLKQDLKKDFEGIQSAFYFTFEYLHGLDKRNAVIEHDLDTLKSGMKQFDEQYKAYRKKQTVSTLIGVAVALIPLIGNSIANVIAAGLEVSNIFIERYGKKHQLECGSSRSKSCCVKSENMNGTNLAGIPHTLFEKAISGLNHMNDDRRKRIRLQEVNKILNQYGENVNSLREAFELQFRKLHYSSSDSSTDNTGS